MTKAFLKKFFITVLAAVLVLFYIPRSTADNMTPGKVDIIDMIAGDIQTVAAHNLTRVSVTNPDVADISDAQNDKISLLAKKAGETSLFLWDSKGKRSVKVRVVNEDLDALMSRVQKVVDEAGITGITYEENMDIGKLVLIGNLTRDDKNRLNDVLEPYSENLLNLVKEEKSEDLIEVDMQVVEISTTLEKNLGITWNNAVGGQESTSSQPGTAVLGSGLVLPYVETPPTTNGKIGDFFKIGNFNRSFQLQATVNALLQEGKARLISKPRLVAVSGKQASFLVGGEIPIQNTTTSASGGTTTGSQTLEQYGVNMTVTPTIRKGKIDVLLNVDIRDVDNSSSFSTNSNVAFITRTASTELLMDNKQTIALAGLIKYQDSVTLTEVPFFSKIPILGALFRNHNEPADSNTEMVIILTPIVLTEKKIAKSQLVMPTPSEREANEEINAKYERERLPDWPAAKTDQNQPIPLTDLTAPAAATPQTAPTAPMAPVVQTAPPLMVSMVPAAPTAPTISMASKSSAAPTAPAQPAPAVQTPPPVPMAAATMTAPTVPASSMITENNPPVALPDITAYARTVQEKISNAITYPRQANGKVLSGTVKLKLKILKDGSLNSAFVEISSGNYILDEVAMKATRSAAPYGAFTTGMNQDALIFTVPIVFNKIDPDKHASAEKVIASY